MLRYPISTLLYLAKINIKDKIQDALKLHNNIDVRLTITIKDKDGKIIKVHNQKSHSFVANFLDIIGTLFANTTYNVTTTSGNAFGYAVGETVNLNCGSPGICGIVIGTGTATPTPNDYRLELPIANGTGSGQLVYSNPTFTKPSVSGNTTSMTISQTFQNQSGASITVTEVGMIAAVWSSSITTQYVLITHDLLSSPITIPNGGVMAITYTISVTT